MNDQLEQLMYESGLTAQGCWDEMDQYDRDAIMKFAELIVRECVDIVLTKWSANPRIVVDGIKEHFGVLE